MKVVDAIGAQLDWMVAKADENLHPKGDVRLLDGEVFTIEPGNYEQSDRWQRYSPSTNWAQGGPILDRERITIRQWTNMPSIHAYMPHDGAPWGAGPTPLIAVMRCFCCSKLGSEIEVPEELTCSPTPKND